MTCYIYILSSRSRALYIGITNDLQRRLFEHREQTSKCARTARYRINRLVYFEVSETAYVAIARQKQLKGGCAPGKSR